MKARHFSALRHPIAIAVVALAGIFCALLPFMPGNYLEGAGTLAFSAHLVGALGLILVPVGVVWLGFMVYRKDNVLTRAVLPLYLIVVPGFLLLVQLVFAAPLTEWSRNRVIESGAEIIRDIEAYYEIHGHYPLSLVAVWPDYSPGVMGSRQYYYERQGESYNLIFEQPRFLLDGFGAREFVVYNPLDEHRIVSHASWRLTHPDLQGWYARRQTGIPHWESFLFD